MSLYYHFCKRDSGCGDDSYRQVSLTCATCKKMKQMPGAWLRNDLPTNHFLYSEQQDPRIWRSVLANFLLVCEWQMSAQTDGYSMGIVFVDFGKDFYNKMLLKKPGPLDPMAKHISELRISSMKCLSS